MSTVSVQKIKDHSYESIKAAVDQVVADLGGLGEIIKPGDKVMIKPNMVAPSENRLGGTVTRWEVCLAIYEAVQAAGGVPFIAESAAAGRPTEPIIQMTGYQELRDRGIPVIDLKAQGSPTCYMPIENGKVYEKIQTYELVRDTDVIITVPVMKTHEQTEITLGIKNLKGCLTDAQKKAFHREGLLEGVVDWCATLKPALQIVDGTYGQEGVGPVWGDQKEMRLIIGSRDMVACEAVTGKIMGFEPEEVLITRAAYARGLGEMDLDKITVVGKQIEEVASRFVRSNEVTIEGLPESFSLIEDDKTCTGCRNTALGLLMSLKRQNNFAIAEDLIMVAGPCTRDQLPAHATAENTLCIGVCAKKLSQEMGCTYIPGCPPLDTDIIEWMKERHQ